MPITTTPNTADMLDQILPRVQKPIRYVGSEYNITIKSHPTVYVGIIFPEVYELGMSNLGIKIIYHLFNRESGVQCERIFAPWPDFGDRLRREKIPLYGLETKKPIREFDLIGFSLQSELSYTTVLYILDTAGIPFKKQERADAEPIIIAGGPAVLNPAPLSGVFDAFVIGDAEDIVGEIARVLRTLEKSRKEARIRALSEIDGVWVPAIHGFDKAIRKRIVPRLAEEAVPTPVILPTCGITHDRLAVEVMRGCTWGCRFCQSGYINRPLRVRPAEEVIRAVEKGIRETGWEEVSLLSFSILDYPDLYNLVRRLNDILKKKNISISLPAMRGELFSEELAILLREIKKTGLTFAPETACDDLRKRINKPFSNERLISSIAAARRQGWKQVKLYFMVGLPFERPADVAAINGLVADIRRAVPGGNIKLSVAPFIPKPHTPFESTPFAPIEELAEKIQVIRRTRRRGLEVNYQSPEVSFVEAFLARGDAKIQAVIEEVYRQGGRFEEWRESFDFQRWQTAFARTGVDPADYLKPRDRYPWDFVDIGVSKDFLRREYANAARTEVTGNCLHTACTACGACDGIAGNLPGTSAEKYTGYGRYPKREKTSTAYRIKYSVGEQYRYASHLDIARMIYRALRRSDLPIEYTRGYSPLPRVSFSPPKSVGIVSRGDFFDVFLESEYLANLSRELNARFPSGIRILDVRSLPPKTPALSSVINLIHYEIPVGLPDRGAITGDPAAGPVLVETAGGRKNIAESVAAFEIKDQMLRCGLYFGPGKINIYDLLSYLTSEPVEAVRTYRIARTGMFIYQNGVATSPMEVK